MLLLERFSQFHILTILLFLIINEDDVNPVSSSNKPWKTLKRFILHFLAPQVLLSLFYLGVGPVFGRHG